MLYAIYALLNSKEPELIESWNVAYILMTYTTILNVIGLILVRLRKVWEDARTLSILTFIILLTIPMIMDELVIKNLDHTEMIFNIYFLFVLMNIKLFFYISKIKLPFLYYISLFLTLGVYIYYPILLLPYLIEPNRNMSLLLIYLFPFFLTLSCLPSILLLDRISNKVVNPTPWVLPWNPWLLLVLVLLSTPFKVYTLMMVYVPGKMILPYLGILFMMPVFLVLAFFFLKVGLREGKSIYYKLYWSCLILSLGSTIFLLLEKDKMQIFIEMLEYHGISTLFISCALCLLLKIYALFKSVPFSKVGVLILLLANSLCRLDTYHLNALHQPHSIWLIIALFFLGYLFIKNLSSKIALVALCVFCYLSSKYVIPFEKYNWGFLLNVQIFSIGLLAISYYLKDKFTLYIEYSLALIYPILIILNIVSFENSHFKNTALVIFFVLSLMIILGYTWRKKNLVYIYSFITSWTVFIIVHIYLYKFSDRNIPLKQEYLTLYLSLSSLFFAVVISFSKAKIISYETIFLFIKKRYEFFLILHYKTINRDISYCNAFFPIVFYSVILMIFYKTLISLNP